MFWGIVRRAEKTRPLQARGGGTLLKLWRRVKERLILSVLALLAISLAVIAFLGVKEPASAQAPPLGVYPGDPVSEADKVFVTLDSSANATCGVTRANNIRCWGDNRYAPLWAGGFTDVAVGKSHSCGLKTDGTVQCWGLNSFGYNMLSPPTDGGTTLRFKSIDSNADHTCGILIDNNQVVCWGSDGNGRSSGIGAGSNDKAFDYSDPSATFQQIDTGYSHTCGILTSSTGTNLRCWGLNPSPLFPSEVHSSAPYAGDSFKDISAGSRFTCGIIHGGPRDGKAVCWGSNQYSQLGTTQGTPAPFGDSIGVPSQDSFTQISAGYGHVCGIKTDGTLSCWGADYQHDNPLRTYRFGQATVPAEYRDATWSYVVAAQYHTCAILDGQNGQLEGDVVCWGAKIPYDPIDPRLVPDGRIFDPDRPYPPPHRFPQIDSGLHYNCGLSASLDLVCWGGSTSSPGIVEGPFKALAMGEQHVCGIRDSGHVNCWGFNNNLQASGWSRSLRPGSRLEKETAAVEHLTNDYTFKSVSASYFHTCGILDGQTVGQADGAVLCWGHKTNGQATPPAGMTFTSISTGLYHTCGLLDAQNSQTAGKVVCWGAENNLDGTGNVVKTIYSLDSKADWGQADIPVGLQDIAFKSISASRYHTCGIRADNDQLACWGSADLAEVPEGLADESFTAVASAWHATCGINSESLAKCWGPDSRADYVGQFRIPTDYAETRFRDISVGWRHACATKENGKVICWGADANLDTPQLEIYRGTTIINTRQAWVPREFRASPINPPLPPTPRPPSTIRILRIEPDIRTVRLRPGVQARLDIEVYGRQDIRDDALGDLSSVTFEWTAEAHVARAGLYNGEFSEGVYPYEDRDSNLLPDDRRVFYNAPLEPGRYRVTASLDIGTECLPARHGETDQDAIERCTAVFEIEVLRRTTPQPMPAPPVDPSDAPDIIVDTEGRNYEVFTPSRGGEIEFDDCTFKAPAGAVNNEEVIGISIAPLVEMEEQLPVSDPRFMTAGVQCRIEAVDVFGAPMMDYRLNVPGEICMPLPNEFRIKAVNALVGLINEDSTLTRLSSKLYIASAEGSLKICGSISTLSATTVAALPGELVDELPPTPIPDVEEPETGSYALPIWLMLTLVLVGCAAVAVSAMTMQRRRPRL